jgi:hypothetical protein
MGGHYLPKSFLYIKYLEKTQAASFVGQIKISPQEWRGQRESKKDRRRTKNSKRDAISVYRKRCGRSIWNIEQITFATRGAPAVMTFPPNAFSHPSGQEVSRGRHTRYFPLATHKYTGSAAACARDRNRFFRIFPERIMRLARFDICGAKGERISSRHKLRADLEQERDGPIRGAACRHISDGQKTDKRHRRLSEDSKDYLKPIIPTRSLGQRQPLLGLSCEGA